MTGIVVTKIQTASGFKLERFEDRHQTSHSHGPLGHESPVSPS